MTLETSCLHAPIGLHTPPEIAFGAGSIANLAAFAARRAAKRILVIADGFNAARVELLGLSGEVMVFGRVKPEPDLPNLADALDYASEVRPDLVVGFGGGSAMDLAKLVAVLAGGAQTIQDVVGVEKVVSRKPALVQVTTTSGTGSEAGTRALVSDPATGNKLAVQSRYMLADLAIIDPDLTLSLPQAVTVATGIDALAHCVEAYTSRKSHPVIDVYALAGIELVGHYLGRAATDGADKEARAGLALASLYGGFCLGPVNTTAGHAVAYPLGTRHHLAHGLSCALIFPHVLAFNEPAVPIKTARVLKSLGIAETSHPQGIMKAARRWCADLGIDMRLSAYNVPEDDFDRMAQEAYAIRRLLDNNPRDMSEADIAALYHQAF